MSKKTTQVVTKTYGSSWITSIILAFIVGLIGLLIGNASGMQNGILLGFVAGFVMTLGCELLVLASMIPYVGIYLQWVWSLQLSHWITGLAGFASSFPMNTLLYLPLILFMVYGAILYAVITGVVTVAIGALIGEIFG
jgi:hypothetical protein